MVLDAEGPKAFAAETFEGVVVEVDVRQLDVLVFERVYVNAEAVVLRGYLDLAGIEIFDGVICAAVAELELVCFSAECKA